MLAAMLALIPAGCGGSKDRPALGQVHGRVTLDGKPLAARRSRFQAAGRRRPRSMGMTDANGEYALKYIRDDLGAALREEFRANHNTADARSRERKQCLKVQQEDDTSQPT